MSAPQFTPGFPGHQITFGPRVTKPRSANLLERLRETKDGYPQTGSGGIDSTGKGFIRMDPAPQVSVNPDGAQAAALIEELVGALEEAICLIPSGQRTALNRFGAILAKARGEA